MPFPKTKGDPMPVTNREEPPEELSIERCHFVAAMMDCDDETLAGQMRLDEIQAAYFEGRDRLPVETPGATRNVGPNDCPADW